MSSNTHTNGTLQTFEKNRYFAAKLMTARDMLAEQDYHAERLETLARYVNGEGVVSGLAVDSIEADGTALTVGLLPGVALDADGNPIVVTGSDPVVAKRSESDADADVDPEDPVALYLRYDECSVERVPLPGSENACKQECTYNRVLEVYEIVAVQPVPDDLSTLPGQKPVPSIAFPRPADVTEVVSETDGETIPETDPGLRKIATAYHQGKDDSNRDPPDVFLGVWERDSDDSWTQLEHGALVYTNDMLYAAIARHAADFHNPHHTTLELSAAVDESEPDDEAATAFLRSGAIYATDETLLFDGTQLVETAVDTAFEETDDQQRRFRLRKSVGQGEWDDVASVELDEAGKLRLETADLDGTYTLVYVLRRMGPNPVLREIPVKVLEDGVGELAEDADLASIAFTVSGDLPPESNDADLVIRDDARPEGTVRVRSSDDTLLVDGTPGADESPAALDLRASIPTLQERLDMVETVNDVGPDDEGNLSLVSGTVQIGSGTEDHTVSLEVPEYDPIESINQVGPSDEGKFFLESDSVDISASDQSPNTLQLEVETGGVKRLNTVEPGADGEIQLRSETLTISPDTDANAVDLEVVDTSGELRDDLEDLGARVDDLEGQSGTDDLEKRVHSLETSRIKHSVHCTGMSYRVLAERYADNESLLEPIKRIIEVVDSVVNTGDYSASAYVSFIDKIGPLQETVGSELNTEIATRSSIDRYQMALDQLTQLPTDAGAVGDLTVAQECLSKAAEWIQKP